MELTPRNRKEWAWLIVLALGLALALLLWRGSERRQLLEAERTRLSMQVGAVEQNLARQLQGVQATLQGVRDDLPAWPAALRADLATRRLLAMSAAMPGTHAIEWLDASGRVLASSRAGAVGRSDGEAAYFRTARAQPDLARVYVSVPSVGDGGVYSLNLTVALIDPQRGFDGVVTAVLEPAYFSTLLNSVLYAADMWATVVHGSGVVLLAYPPNPRAQGLDVARPGTLFSRHRDSGQISTVLEGVSTGTGDMRLIAQRTLRPANMAMDHALVLGVSRSADQMLLGWRAESVQLTGLYLALVGGAALTLRGTQRRRDAEARTLADQRQLQAEHAQRLALALQGGDLALWDLDIASGRSIVNDRWSQMLGHAPGELATDNQNWLALLHPQDLERVLGVLRDHLEGYTPAFEATYRMRHSDGSWVWVLDRGRVVERDASGKALRMVGTHMDISAQVHADEALRQSEENLSITLQSIGDGVIATDAAGRITRLNDAARTLTGWAGDSATGRPLSEVFRIVSAATGQAELDPVARVLAHGGPVGLANGTLLLARDGVEHQIADSAAPIRSASGEVIGVVLVFSDVTEQYRTQQALREREAELSGMADALPCPVTRFDREGRCRFVNAAFERWFEGGAGGFVGRSRRELLGDAVADALEPLVQQALGGATGTLDLPVPTPGGVRTAMLTLVPDRDASGQVCGCYLVAVDISDRHRAEAALRLSESKSRALLEALQSGVVVHASDARVLESNPAASRVLGLSSEQMRGKSAIDPAWAFLEEDGSAMAADRFPVNQVIADGQPLHNLVVGLRRPDLDHPVWALCSAFALHGADGVLQQVVVTFSDFTERKVAEERLRRSEARLRLAGQLARLGGWRLELPDQALWLAPEAAAVLGAAPAGLPTLQALLPLVVPAQRPALEEALREQAPFDIEIEAATVGGRALQLRLMGEPVHDAAGRRVAVHGALQDVTESRREQQRLRLLEACVERLNDVVLITEAEPLEAPGPRIVFVNPAFERLTGWRRDEVLGRPAYMLLAEQSDSADAARLVGALAQHDEVRGEFANVNRRGEAYWVEAEAVKLQDGTGRATHLVLVQRDVSERRRADAAMRSAQDDLAATLEAVPDLLFDIDLQGMVHGHHSPRSDLLVLPAEQQVGRTVAEVLPPDAAGALMQALGQAHLQGRSSGLQYELALPQGKRWFELSVSRKSAAAGEVPRFIVLSRDITERRQGDDARRALERQLREAQKMESIGTLAGGIAHDFNNILAAILGNAALASADLPPGHAARGSLEQINVAGLRARSLVQQILTFSRSQPQALVVQPLQPVVHETLSLLRVTLPASVRLDTELAAEPLQVRADATQLQQVIMNLCTNAWHALPEGRGRIEVGLSAAAAEAVLRLGTADMAPGPWVHLWVADNGSGMDSVTRERIFDPFFTTKPVGQGTGLGLSVVHGIVRGHGGVITVVSAPGVGSTFHVLLPLSTLPQSAVPGTGPAASAVVVAPGSAHHVLYVDDDEVMVLMVQRLLQRAGYGATVCRGAAEALATVEAQPGRFDVVVSDFNMPDMSGIELAAQLLRLRPQLPVLISSGYISEALRQQAKVLGVKALLRKEHTLEQLVELIARVLA